jgi:hypothetical protein
LELVNSRISMNVGGDPTDHKPTVTLTTPQDPDQTSAFINLRVADIAEIHAEWSARGWPPGVPDIRAAFGAMLRCRLGSVRNSAP